jgi:hypothetical protein
MKSNSTDNNMIARQLGGATVYQRKSNGYINASQLCKAAGKQWSNYYQNKNTKDFINELQV